MSLQSRRSEVRRLPSRGYYDKETVYSILDSNYLCHVAFVMEGKPCVIPTAYGREGDCIYVHGSVKSRMMNHIVSGAEVAIAVTQVDGIVLARSLFHSSMNYHSVVVYGTGEELIEKYTKLHSIYMVSERIWPGRWDGARTPNDLELQATSVIKVTITDGAAKIRTGPAKDDSDDYALDIWAGVIPVDVQFSEPVPDERLAPDIGIPLHVLNRIRRPII
jgi:nitroimidazol reductase NimA-like FMN-containing flavoprotein (pyridoxamine 5'-phosphate oxidase superfamily)